MCACSGVVESRASERIDDRKILILHAKMRDVKAFLGRKQSQGGPLVQEWAVLEELYDKR